MTENTHSTIAETDNPTGECWTIIPPYMRGGLNRYLLFGVPPGDFLEAVLCNDLVGAFAHADNYNSRHVRDYVQFLYDYAPRGSWGSKEKYHAWIKHHTEKRKAENEKKLVNDSGE